MNDVSASPSFPVLLQRFFIDHLRQQRAVSPTQLLPTATLFIFFSCSLRRPLVNLRHGSPLPIWTQLLSWDFSIISNGTAATALAAATLASRLSDRF
jgi:hypothetical protein